MLRPRNLRACQPDGSEVWTVKLPTTESSDCFIGLSIGGPDTFQARSFSGYPCDIDFSSDRVIRREFVKM